MDKKEILELVKTGEGLTLEFKEVLREALINAIVHRDYFSSGHVQVEKGGVT